MVNGWFKAGCVYILLSEVATFSQLEDESFDCWVTLKGLQWPFTIPREQVAEFKKAMGW